MSPRIPIFAILLVLFIVPLPAEAQRNSRPSPSLLKQLQGALRQRDQAIQKLSQRLTALEKQVRELQASVSNGRSHGPDTAAPAGPSRPSSPAGTAQRVQPAASSKYDKEERIAQAALDRTLISRGSLLLPPGTIEFDSGISYFDASSDQLYVNGFTVDPILVIGDIVSERTQRDILLPTFTTRLGLPHDLQVDVVVPVGYQSERIITANNTETSRTFSGLGDVEVGITKQLTRGRGLAPGLLAGFRWKSTTGPNPYETPNSQVALGTGFQSFRGNLTLVKPSDPLVYFGSLSYTANLSATKQILSTNPASANSTVTGYVDPGDTIGFQLGLALSVNPVSALNFSVDQRFTRPTSLDGKPLPGTYLSAAVFNLGTTYVYAPGRPVDVGLGIGLSRGAPDFQLSVDFPIRVSLDGMLRVAGF